MFGGYLAFYTKESKTLNINIKTDYWAHPKNRLHNPTLFCQGFDGSRWLRRP